MAQSQLTLTNAVSSPALTVNDQALEKLVRDAQQYCPLAMETLTPIVENLLRSRQICRPLAGQPLLAVQQEILAQARQQLQQLVTENLPHYRPGQVNFREWANSLRKLAFGQTLSDTYLKKLALAAQQASPHTPIRQHLLRELIEAIRLSGNLCRPHREKFSADFYELLYEEAVNETLLYVCQNIDKYDPERGKDKKFITWVNFRLDKLVLECRRRFNHFQNQEITFLSLSDLALEQLPETLPTPSLGESLRNCLEVDPEGLFQAARIRNKPQANFRAIALARLAGKSWQEISQDLDLAVPTLSSFYQRCCRKFMPQFQKYLET